jgi:hypothetical protein
MHENEFTAATVEERQSAGRNGDWQREGSKYDA